MSKLVEYHNDINDIPLRKLTEKELNIFFSIIYKAKDEKTDKIKLDFLELRKLSNGDTHTSRFVKALDSMDKKLLQLNQKVEIEKGVSKRFNLFNDFTIDTNKKILTVSIHEMFSYMLNGLLKNITKFELSQIIKLKSSYSKNMFRILKQFESTGYRIIKLEKFKILLCVPDSYRMSEINKWVLNPIMEELTPLFPNLTLEKVKKGRTIDRFIFTWGNRNLLNGEIAPGVQPKKVEEIEISEGLYRIFEKVKKNRFIKPLITSQNIAHLVNKYSELELIEGLNFASTEIKTEIKSINYLIKTINTGIVQDEIKIVVKKATPNDLQGVETKKEEKKGLKTEIGEPKSEELKEFINEIGKIGKDKVKGSKYYEFRALLNSCSSFETVNELILKYELNGVVGDE
jgi:plasmid replication initiation protein